MTLSPDGAWFWDGAAWQQTSPDRGSHWDGTTWVPIGPSTSKGGQGERLGLTVEDMGTTVINYKTDHVADTTFAVVLRNPNATLWWADGVEVDIIFRDRAEGVRHVETRSIASFAPGAAVGFGGEFSGPPGEGGRTSIEVSVGEWRRSDVEAGWLEVEGVRVAEADGALITTGMIRSHYEQDRENVTVTAVHYNKKREIIGGDEAVIDVRGGGVAYFEVASRSLRKYHHTTLVLAYAVQ